MTRDEAVKTIDVMDKLIVLARATRDDAQRKLDRFLRDRDQAAARVWAIDHEVRAQNTVEG